MMQLVKNLKRIFLVYIRDRILARRDLKNFYNVLGGHIYFECLYTAIELDLFSLLDKRGPQTLAQIASALNLDPFACRVLLLGLAATGVIRKSGANYDNTYVGRLILVQGAPLYVGNCVRWQHHIVYQPMFNLKESILENRHAGLQAIPGDGNTLYERLAGHPKLEKIFQDAMEEISYQANSSLAAFLDMRDVKYLVDVGGGNGTNVLAMAREHPHLRGAVFDIPTVCEIAISNFEAHGFSQRLSAIPGNCFTDPFPSGADCFLFCHFMCIWSAADNTELLRKAHAAMGQGGRVVIFDIMQNDDGKGPLAAAMGSPYFLGLATGRGMIYTIAEYEKFCHDAGFRQVERIAFPGEHTAVVAIKS